MFALTTKNDGLFDLFFDRPLDVRPSYQRTKVQTKVVSESDQFKIQIAAVGVPKELVDIQVVGDVLTVSHEHNEEKENSYFCSSFKKSWTLPENTNLEKISAKAQDGIFEISIPKVEPVKPTTKKIEIN